MCIRDRPQVPRAEEAVAPGPLDGGLARAQGSLRDDVVRRGPDDPGGRGVAVRCVGLAHHRRRRRRRVQAVQGRARSGAAGRHEAQGCAQAAAARVQAAQGHTRRHGRLPRAR
eukprot:7378385-Prymnesium_polylepis.1